MSNKRKKAQAARKSPNLMFYLYRLVGLYGAVVFILFLTDYLESKSVPNESSVSSKVDEFLSLMMGSLPPICMAMFKLYKLDNPDKTMKIEQCGDDFVVLSGFYPEDMDVQNSRYHPNAEREVFLFKRVQDSKSMGFDYFTQTGGSNCMRDGVPVEEYYKDKDFSTPIEESLKHSKSVKKAPSPREYDLFTAHYLDENGEPEPLPLHVRFQ